MEVKLKQKRTQRVNRMKNDYFIKYLHECKVPMITIYFNPSDYPFQYVARLFNVNIPTQYCVVADTYNEILEYIPENMHPITRSPSDDISIIETYI